MIRLCSLALAAMFAAGPAFAENAPLAPDDVSLFQPALARALDETGGSKQASWFNRGTRHAGTIVAGAKYRDAKGQTCRKFTQEFAVGQQKRTYPGAACRHPDGSWTVVGG